MQKPFPLVLLLISSLFLPLLGPFSGPVGAKGFARGLVRERMTKDLHERARLTSGTGERARVIVNLSHPSQARRVRTLLESKGAQIDGQLDEIGVITANVPVEKLVELSSSAEVSWLSSDQEVRSLSTAPDNTSHIHYAKLQD